MAEAHLSLLLEMISMLERYAREVRRADLDADRETWLKVKAALEVAARCAIDAALDLVARRGLGTPQTYRDAFAVLARAGVIDAPLRDALQQWAGMRNVLVHMYQPRPRQGAPGAGQDCTTACLPHDRGARTGLGRVNLRSVTRSREARCSPVRSGG